ncbi:class I SAM-dependent methyltransferase [Saccharopolyspora elongata]|uniref:Class I SAM-dependent methyltransferase n=1 Tax=Saccharopolyspora elongata TaxID=2530387 RepID=A0A4R4XVS0_9PSEU|nr:class I SAM-dependent methyltransferase [Saccharopolyspora elongata]TDD35781.1 class I SAM-dependent methyltransferase [Saccharopolyspora elongata]
MPGDDPVPADSTAALWRAAEHLSAHPWIAAAEVDDEAVRLVPARAALAVRPEPGALLTEHLDQWSEVYDWTYSQASGRHADDLDLSGWRASDTGEPFPVEHMKDWLRHTVELVLRDKPRRVLELGCGTGMLMHRLHPHVDAYVGTDVAADAVRKLSTSAPGGAVIVQASAHEARSAVVQDAIATAFSGARPDCVLLNSVTQCFPSVEYLRAVVQDAIDIVAPGGTVIIGDVRHAGLLRDHHRWLDAAATDAELDERVDRDEELLFDAPLLASLAAAAGREVRMATFAKTMRADTELTRYRFDAVLHVDPGTPAVAPTVIRWPDLPSGNRVAALRARLDRSPVRVERIPNRLLNTEAGTTAAELHRAIGDLDAVVCLDPTDPRSLEVIAPAMSAARPVQEISGPGKAHEPLRGFVRRRLAEVARRDLRRGGHALVPITVDQGEHHAC